VRDYAPPVNSSEFLVPVDEDSTTCNSKSINRYTSLKMSMLCFVAQTCFMPFLIKTLASKYLCKKF